MYYLGKVGKALVKRKPHHPLDGVKAKFASPLTLEISGTALRSAAALGHDVDQIVVVVQALVAGDFVKSETAHSPRDSRVWHDSYRAWRDDLELYLKFAGETLIEVALVSYKEA